MEQEEVRDVTRADRKAKFYLHCKDCVEANLPPRIESFVDPLGKVWIWCRNHDREIYHTKNPVMDVSQMACGSCGAVGEHSH